MQLSIIIVNWNSRDHLRKCLESVFSQTSGIEFEVIVIDSASFDGCGEMLQTHFPRVRFIQSIENLGFARANNEAFLASKGETILFLNPDTEVIGPAIKVLHEHMARLSNAGAVGCRLLNSDRSVQTSCIQPVPTILNQLLDSEFLRAKWPKSRLWGMAPLFALDFSPQPVEAISGACVMMGRSLFEQIGHFSEDFFMYAEDIDLSYKATQAGATNYYIPSATVVHYGGSSTQQAASNFSVVMMREAIWRFLRKTRGNLYGLGYRISMLLSSFCRLSLISLARLFGKGNSSYAKWLAILRWSLNRESCVTKYYRE